MDEMGAKRRLYDQMMEFARAAAAKEIEARFGKNATTPVNPEPPEGENIDALLNNPDLKEVGGEAEAATTPEMVAQQLKPTEPIAKETLADNPEAVGELDAELLERLLQEKKK